jgi:hypothetical protein
MLKVHMTHLGLQFEAHQGLVIDRPAIVHIGWVMLIDGVQ